MNNAENTRSSRIACIMTEFLVVGFGILHVYDYYHTKEKWITIVLAATLVFGLFFIALLHRLRRFLNESFFVPLSVYLLYIGFSFAAGDFFYLFPLSLGICCTGALYFNPRSLRNYLLLTNIASLFLVYYKMPHIFHLQALLSQIVIEWYIAVLGSVIIYVVTAFASDKNNAAIKAQDYLTSLLNSTNRIVLVDSKNRVTFYSKPFAEMAHLSIPDWAIGRPIFDLFKDPELKFLFYDILREDSAEKSIRKITLDGKEHHFEIISTRLSDETGGRFVNLVDITSIMEAKIEAEEASHAKNSFLATVSHEIRTPLNAIIGLSEIELQKRLPAETLQNLEKICSSGLSLLAIINDILDISKIEAGGLAIVPVYYDVPGFISDAVNLNVVRINSKNIAFELKVNEVIPSKLFGDELRIKQILTNLLSNAFKYTEKGNVVFSVTCEQPDPPSTSGKAEAMEDTDSEKASFWYKNIALVFTIQDTGQGIKKKDIPRLFEEFVQFDAYINRHVEGTGLGLTITKNLLSLMNGTIDVKSEYGKGSTFTVRIPQQIVDEKPIGEKTARDLELFCFKRNHQGQELGLTRSYMPYGKVLVVDDVEVNLDVAKGLILPYGIPLDFALSGPEAIEKIRAAGEDTAGQKYDLVLMDHMMPGMDGLEAVKIIRNEVNNDYAKNVPIVALTANAMSGNERLFLSNGFNAFISKPIDLVQLDTVFNTWIRDKQSKETLLQAEKEASEKKVGLDMENNPDNLGVFKDFFVDGVDFVKGLQRFQTEAAYLDVIRAYHLYSPSLLEKIRFPLNGIGNVSLSEYAVTVHGLKGSSYGICADAVAKEAAELEKAAKAGDKEYVLAKNNSFIESVESLIANLGELLKKAAAGAGEKPRVPSPDTILLSKLLEAASRYKASRMGDIIKELESYQYESDGELVIWLREQLDNLEYQAIKHRLETKLSV